MITVWKQYTLLDGSNTRRTSRDSISSQTSLSKEFEWYRIKTSANLTPEKLSFFPSEWKKWHEIKITALWEYSFVKGREINQLVHVCLGDSCLGDRGDRGDRGIVRWVFNCSAEGRQRSQAIRRDLGPAQKTLGGACQSVNTTTGISHIFSHTEPSIYPCWIFTSLSLQKKSFKIKPGDKWSQGLLCNIGNTNISAS